MPTGDYLEGVVLGGLTLAGILGGALLLRRRRYGQLVGASAAVAFGVLATLGALAVHLLPAILGVLDRETVVAAAALWLAVAASVPAVDGAPEPPPGGAVAGGRAAGLLAAGSALLLALLALAIARDQLVLAPDSIDALNFILPNVASWIQSGTIWEINSYLADVSPGQYPNNGDVALLAVTLPWRNDFLVHFAMLPFWALTGTAVYAIAREGRAPRAAAVSAACLVLAMPAVAIPGVVGSLVDPVMLFGFAAGLLFLLRFERFGRRSELVLAGLALGVAFGAKWYGVSSVVVVLVVWALVRRLQGRATRAVARDLLIVASMVAVAGGIWMLRNLIESGNPVFPVRVAPFGIELFDAPHDPVRELAGFTIADYAASPGVWADYIVPQLRQAWALPGAILLAGLVAAAVSALRRSGPARGTRRSRASDDRVLLAVGVVIALALLCAYAITPYTAGGAEGRPSLVGPDARYGAPALLVCGVLAAWAAGRFRRGPLLLGIATVIAVIDGARLTARGELSGASPGLGDWLAAVGALAVAFAIWRAVTWARGRGLFERGLRRRHVVAGGVAALAAAAVLVGVGYELQDRYNDRRYLGGDPTTDALLTGAPADRRIGLSGLWDDTWSPVLPAFGPRYGNHVEYVGASRREVIRRFRDRREFVASVRGRDLDYLVIGRGRAGVRRIPELRWARSAGFEPLVKSDRLVLFGPAAASPSAPG
jgi:hypothetical protein